MSLSGLLSPLSDDPALTRALSLPPDPPGPPGSLSGADLVGPPALRPVLAAALTGAGLAGPAAPADGQPDGQAGGRFVLAVTATAPGGRGPGRGAGLPAARRARRAYFPAWETLPHERLSPALGHRRAGGSPCCAGWPTRTDGDPRSGPLSVVVAPVRGAAAAAASTASATSSRSRCTPATTADLDEVVTPAGRDRLRAGRPGREARRVRRPRRHPRRLPAHRGAPAPGRVLGRRRSRRSATSRSPTSAPCRAGRPGCGRRPAGSCCSPTTVRERAAALAAEHPDLAEMLDKLADGHRRRGHGVARAGAGSTGWSCCSTTCRPGACVLVCDPERIRTRAARPGARPARSSCRRPGQRGRRRRTCPIDLGAAAFRPLADVRAAADALGLPWWTIAPFGRRAGRGAAGPQLAGRPGRRRRQPGRCRSGRRTSRPDRVHHRRKPPRRPTAATPRRRSPTSGAGSATAGGSSLVTEGHGPAQRLAEVLRDAGRSARQDRGPGRPAGGRAWRRSRRGLLEHGFVGPALRLAVLTETRPGGQRTGGQGQRSDAEPAPRHHRPAAAQRRRLRRARAARRRPVRGDDQRTVQGADPRVPGHRVRAGQARPARRTGCTCPPTSWTRSPGTSAARRRRCTGSAARTGPRPRAGPARRSGRSPPS